MKTIHVTERASFRSCRRRWYWQHVRKLVPKDRTQDPTNMGSLVHHALSVYYSNAQEWRTRENRLAAMWQSWEDYLCGHPLTEELKALSEGMLRYYTDWEDALPEHLRLEPVAVEQTFTAKVPGTNVRLAGKCDLIVRDVRGDHWVLDHKTYRAFKDERDLQLDDQSTAYIWLVRNAKNGYPVKGAILNMLRKKVAVMPPQLKNGSLSKAQNIDTTPELYRQAVIAYGLDPADYADILQKLEGNDFVRRLYCMRSRRALESFAENLTHEARDMTSKNTPIYPNFDSSPASHCGYCGHRDLCITQIDKGDVEHVAASLYTVEAPYGDDEE